jgi:ElaB/YqjD/DUF883 family membrane-anchored ribosome-binding protein
MNQAMNEFDRARGRITSDFKTMIADGEDLLQAAASVSGEGFAAARAKFEGKLQHARLVLADASRPVDSYVRGNPWSAVGAAMAAGALIGFLAAKR